MVRPFKKTVLQLSIGLSLGFTALTSMAASPDYRNFETIEKQIQAFAQKHPERVKLQVIGKSAGGDSLYFVQIASAGKS